MTLPPLVPPATVAPAGDLPRWPQGIARFPLAAELPQAPFFRAVWQNLAQLQLHTPLAGMPRVHLWLAHLLEPAIHTGGHWSPLASTPQVPIPIMMFSTPDTFADQAVERLHQLTLPPELHGRLLGQAMGVRLRPGTAHLQSRPAGLSAQLGENLSLALQPAESALPADPGSWSMLPDFWLTLQGNTRRLLRLKSPPACPPWRALVAEPNACFDWSAVHPLLQNARLHRAFYLPRFSAESACREPEGAAVILHRPVCVQGPGCLRSWRTIHPA